MKYNILPPLSIKQKENFWKKVSICEQNACWNWVGAVRHNGYGLFNVTVNKKQVPFTASRVAYELAVKTPNPNLMVLHSCDNRLCCNPKHLRIGTLQDNSQDMMIRGRSNKGSKRPLSKLTENDIVKIKRLWEDDIFSQHEIAALFRVNQSQISRAIHGKRWKHVQ